MEDKKKKKEAILNFKNVEEFSLNTVLNIQVEKHVLSNIPYSLSK